MPTRFNSNLVRWSFNRLNTKRGFKPCSLEPGIYWAVCIDRKWHVQFKTNGGCWSTVFIGTGREACRWADGFAAGYDAARAAKPQASAQPRADSCPVNGHEYGTLA